MNKELAKLSQEQTHAYKTVCKKCGYFELLESDPKEWTCKICEGRKSRIMPDGSKNLSSLRKIRTCPKGHKQLCRSFDEPCKRCVELKVEKKMKILIGVHKDSKLFQTGKQLEKIHAKADEFHRNKRLEQIKLEKESKEALIKIPGLLEQLLQKEDHGAS